jgi:hypothetical protein
MASKKMDQHKTSPSVIRVKSLSLTRVTIMHPKQRIEEIIKSLRPAFSREAAFEWFVMRVWGSLLCNRATAITSYLNAVGLSE